MKLINVIWAISMTLLVVAVSLLGGTSFAKGVGDFIAYSSCVPIVRKTLIGCGGAIVAIAFVYGAICKLSYAKIVVVMSDGTALFFFLVMLVGVTLLCFELASVTHCDFWQLQQSVALVLSFTGCLVAVRSKRYRYVLYYIILFLLFGGIIPPT